MFHIYLYFIFGEQSIGYTVPKVWDSLPNSLRQTTSLKEFKNLISTWSGTTSLFSSTAKSNTSQRAGVSANLKVKVFGLSSCTQALTRPSSPCRHCTHGNHFNTPGDIPEQLAAYSAHALSTALFMPGTHFAAVYYVKKICLLKIKSIYLSISMVKTTATW